MNEKGANMLLAIREVRQLFEDIGLLLRSGEEHMKKAGWTPYNSVAMAGGSRNVSSPAYWMPQDVFRFFLHKEEIHVLSFISVIVDDINDPNSMDEPFVSAGWIEFEDGEKVGNSWSYDYSRIVLNAEKRTTIGEIMEVPTDSIKSRSDRKIKRARALAIPLVSITDVASVETMITEILIKDIPESL